MMAKRMTVCKTCGEEIAVSAKTCPHCGAKNKKPIYQRWWLWALVIAAAIAAFGGTGGKDKTEKEREPQTVSAPEPVPAQARAEEQAAQAETDETEQDEPEQENPAVEDTLIRVGDAVMDGELKITYVASGEYEEENQFLQPEEGNKYIFLRLAFENNGTSDRTASALSFDCYADGAACEQSYVRDDTLSATLSPGRKVRGSVTFEVPLEAETVEVEYLAGFWTSSRLVFDARIR